MNVPGSKFLRNKRPHGREGKPVDMSLNAFIQLRFQAWERVPTG
jgi:hypothetical protein